MRSMSELLGLKKEVEQLQYALAATTFELSLAVDRASDETEERQKLEKELQCVQTIKEELVLENQEVVNELQAYSENILDLESQVESLRQEVFRLKSQLHDMRTKNDELVDQLCVVDCEEKGFGDLEILRDKLRHTRQQASRYIKHWCLVEKKELMEKINALVQERDDLEKKNRDMSWQLQVGENMFRSAQQSESVKIGKTPPPPTGGSCRRLGRKPQSEVDKPRRQSLMGESCAGIATKLQTAAVALGVSKRVEATRRGSTFSGFEFSELLAVGGENAILEEMNKRKLRRHASCPDDIIVADDMLVPFEDEVQRSKKEAHSHLERKLYEKEPSTERLTVLRRYFLNEDSM